MDARTTKLIIYRKRLIQYLIDFTEYTVFNLNCIETVVLTNPSHPVINVVEPNI